MELTDRLAGSRARTQSGQHEFDALCQASGIAHLSQKGLGHLCPLQALKAWQHARPQLFSKAVRNHPGPDP